MSRRKVRAGATDSGGAATQSKSESIRSTSTHHSESSASRWAAIAVIIVAILACYQRSFHQDFVMWDDQIHVFQNPYLTALTPANIGYFWTHPYEKLYVPVSYTVFALIAEAARLPAPDRAMSTTGALFNPHFFHAANIALHIVNSLLVYFLLVRLANLFGAGRRVAGDWPALAGTLLFALHPLQVESVAWVSELRGLLSAMFFLAAALCYLASVSSFVAKELPKRRWWYAAAIAFEILALLAKPLAAALPLVLLVIDRWAVGRSWRECASWVAPFALVVIPFVFITQGAQPVPPQDIPPIWLRPFVAGDSLAFYLAKLFAPIGLTIDYGRKTQDITHSTFGYLTWLAPAALAAIIFALRKRAPWLVAADLISVSYLLPVLGLMPFVFQDQSTVADRYVYLAMIGPALILTMVLTVLPDRWRLPAYGVAGIVVVGCAVITVNQLRHWDNSWSLLSYAAAEAPRGAQIDTDYGLQLQERGDLAGAIEQYRQVIAVNPGFARAYSDLGYALMASGDVPDALAPLSKAVEMEPDYYIMRRNYGVGLLASKDLAGAEEQFAAEARLAPYDSLSHSQYAGVLVMRGELEQGLAEYQAAVNADPHSIIALNGLADVQIKLGQVDDAGQTLQKALQVNPDDQRALSMQAAIQGKR